LPQVLDGHRADIAWPGGRLIVRISAGLAGHLCCSQNLAEFKGVFIDAFPTIKPVLPQEGDDFQINDLTGP